MRRAVERDCAPAQRLGAGEPVDSVFSSADVDEFKALLIAKIGESTTELESLGTGEHSSNVRVVGELHDLVDALARLQGVTSQDVDRWRADTARRLGGYSYRIVSNNDE